jgi:hypothetical protein
MKVAGGKRMNDNNAKWAANAIDATQWTLTLDKP